MYRIKQQPEDFVVEEIMELKKSESGKYAYFLLEKKGQTTEEAVQRVSKSSGIPRKLISYAGAKDKEAVTRQFICVPSEYRNKISLPEQGHGDERIGLGSNTGNRFTIVVRGLDSDVAAGKPTQVPNYFDEQRFSADNADIGLAIIKGDFGKATALLATHEGRYEQEMKRFLGEQPGNHVGALQIIPKKTLLLFVHAYQSRIWNRAAAAHLKTTSNAGREITYSEGTLFFPYEKREQEQIALPGFESELEGEAAGSCGMLVQAELDHDEVSLRDFIVRQMPELTCSGDVRDLFVEPADFSASEPQDDELNPGKKKITISFSLPKGSYATMVVKALFA